MLILDFDNNRRISYSLCMGKGNFFSNLFASLFNSNDPEAFKKKQLKAIAKDLSKSKFHFFKASSKEVDPSLAKFIYEVYKIISPAQQIFENANPNALKSMVITSFMNEAQIAETECFTEAYITEMAHKLPVKDVKEGITQKFEEFKKNFDDAKLGRIDRLYTKFMLFKSFVQFDFYFFLKKFDSTIKERNFNAPPKFQPINGTYIIEDLKNFIDIAWGLPFDQDWDDMFKFLKQTRGAEIVAAGTWKKILNRIKTIKDQGVFEMLIQYFSEDPRYKSEYKSEEFFIVDDYINSLKKQWEDVIYALEKKQTAGKVESLASQIFGTAQVPKLSNYNQNSGNIYERKGLGAFLYTDPLAYTKAFLLEYTKKEIRELSDILLVRGDWANPQLSKPMSQAYHDLLEISSKISELDNRLSEQMDLGNKLKTYLPRSDRDKEARNIIQIALRDANNAAAEIIIETTKDYITYAKNLKMLLEDFVKYPKSEIILNWRDIDHFAEGQLKKMSIEAYKKLYAFVQLMQNFPVQVEED